MEVRGNHRSFMETMRAFFTTIRKRIGQRRTRQRTNNYRICSNLAMAKTESKKERRLKKAKMTKENNPANAAAEENSTKIKDGAPRGLRERMMSALRAFREGRKSRSVCQRGKRRNTDGLNMQDTQAGEDIHEPQPNPEVQTRVVIHTQAGEHILSQARDNIPTQARENLQETHTSADTHTGDDIQNQAKEDIQTLDGEKHQAGKDLQTQTAEENIHTQAGQESRGNLHEPQASSNTRAGEDIQKAGEDFHTQAKKDLQIQAGEDLPDTQARDDIKTEAVESLQTQASPEIQAREDIQSQAQEDLLPAEPASWVVKYGQMWQRIAQHDGHELDREDLHATQATEEPASWVVANSQMWQRMDLYVEGAYARESLDNILAREGLEADEPASWFVANGQIWGNTHDKDKPFIRSMPIMNSWLISMSMENCAERGVQVTSPYKHTGLF